MKNSNQGDFSNHLNLLKKRIVELEDQLAVDELQFEKSKLMMQLLDSATDSVFLHDFDGNFVYVNKAAYKTRGYAKEELMGMNLHELDVPKYEKLIKPRIKELMEKGESIFETAHFRKDGSQLPVEIHSRIIEYKNKQLVLSYARDITKRKKIENDLVSAQEQYRALFDDIGVGIAFISPKMEILDLNGQMKGWFPHIDVSKKPICYQAFNVPPREDICTYCPTYKTLEDGEVHESVTDTPIEDEIINYRIVSSPIKDEGGNVVAAIEMVEDITARKRTEEELKRAYATFNSIFEGPENIIAFSLDRNYQYIFFNQAHKQTMKNIWNVDIEIGENMLNYISYQEDREKAKINFDRVLSGENFIELEEYGEESHSRRYWENIYNPIQSGKDVMGLTVFCIDITERQKAEENLRQSEEKFRAVAESAIDAIITADSKGMITFFNRSLLELFGYSASELSGKPVSILIPTGHRNGHLRGMKLMGSGEKRRTGKTTEVVGLKKDGTEFPCEMSLSSWKSGEDTYFTSIIRDLTERQRAEEALRESEEKYRTIFENVQDVFFQTDIHGNIIEVSPSVEKQFGIKSYELIGNHVDMLYFNSEDRKKLLETLQEKGEVLDYEIKLRNSENQLVYISANVHFIYDSKNHPIGIEGALRNITERKLAENALKNSEAEYRAIFENSKSAVAVYNAVDNGSNFIFKDFNKAAERIEKIKRADVVGRKITEVFPSVVEFGLFEVFQRVWKTGKPEKHPISIYQDERIWGWRENYVYKLPSGDVVAVYDDLTEIKQYEKELEKNQSRLKSLVRILQYKGDSVKEFLEYALEEAIQLTESKLGYIAHYYEDKELFILNTWSRDVMKDCSITPLPTVFKLEETGIWTEPVRQRKPIILNDFQAPNPLKRGYPEGHSTIYKYMTIPVFSGDKIVAVVAVANKTADYTETDVLQLQLLMDGVWKVVDRQKAEETIKENEKRLKILFEYAPDPYFISTFEGKILDGNKAVEGFIGYRREEFLDKTVVELNLLNKEDSLRVAEAMAKHAQGQYVEPMEWRIRKKDGNIISAETTAFPIEIKGQRVVLIMGRDITERKKVEKALKLSRMRLSNAMDLAHLASWELDPYKQVFIFNDRFYSMLGTNAENEGGYAMSIENYIKKYVHPEDAKSIAEEMKASLDASKSLFDEEFEHRVIRTDGEIRYMAIRVKVIPATEDRGGHVYGTVQDVTEHKISSSKSSRAYVYGSVQDITERKIAEEKLKESLEEKEMLLKEIHHRVKNNLMVISSLLNLQSQYIQDREALDIFKESQNRARSMALIHERLYRSTDLKKIDFGDYIHTLATDLFHTYVPDPSRVKLNMDLENVMVDINTTVPLGLIVNELVTNCMKHAFPEGKKGEINIEFFKKGDEFILVVSDTGVGFPEGLDFRNTPSLGLQLVNNLVSQIDGEITLDKSHGTEFKITFKELEYKKRT